MQEIIRVTLTLIYKDLRYLERRGFMSDVLYVDDNTFEAEVMNSKIPVLVDFSAVWCGPCQRQLPILEKFAREYLNKIKVIKIDVDESPMITAKLAIRGVPSLVLFNLGERLETKVGLTSPSDLADLIRAKIGI